MENPEYLNQLSARIDQMLQRQQQFLSEIQELQSELHRLKHPEPMEPIKEIHAPIPEQPFEKTQESAGSSGNYYDIPFQKNLNEAPFRKRESTNKGWNLEKFVGENLISKIGIIIVVIGVFIGVKYSIEHQLISPVTRIIAGYIAGLGLLGLGIRLKKSYDNFSAVLISGAIAIMYFITFIAYGFYGLISQIPAFGLMVVFTIATVYAAISFNKQIIGLFGMVGAYAVPILLSDDSGNILFLFVYMIIINTGILYIAFKKYWKLLYYASFSLTWLIYLGWYTNQYLSDTHFGIAITFLSGFFLLFYAMFLTYKLLQKEQFQYEDIILMLVNSSVFYGTGYSLIQSQYGGENLLGLFTLFNALIHLLVSSIIYRQKLADRNLFYLIAGLVLVFFTMAIPVQLNGNWVTLLWAGEALALYWVGVKRKVNFYLILSYPLMILAFISIIQDWNLRYDITDEPFTFLINIQFASGLLFLFAFGYLYKLLKDREKELTNSYLPWLNLDTYLIPGILVVGSFFTFRMEIATYLNQLYADSFLSIQSPGQEYPYEYYNDDLKKFKTLWLINYTLIFGSILTWLSRKKLTNSDIYSVALLLNGMVILVFLGYGLFQLSELRESYLNQNLAQYYDRGVFNIWFRYPSILCAAIPLVILYRIKNKLTHPGIMAISLDLVIHLSLLWVLSSELLNWLDIAGQTQTYKLGLSILWGVYSLAMIVMGLFSKKKHLRIGAMALFGVTLLKLFFYDMSELGTIAKTIVFISLGILLLIISFLYNKYKSIIEE